MEVHWMEARTRQRERSLIRRTTRYFYALSAPWPIGFPCFQRNALFPSSWNSAPTLIANWNGERIKANAVESAFLSCKQKGDSLEGWIKSTRRIRATVRQTPASTLPLSFIPENHDLVLKFTVHGAIYRRFEYPWSNFPFPPPLSRG